MIEVVSKGIEEAFILTLAIIEKSYPQKLG